MRMSKTWLADPLISTCLSKKERYFEQGAKVHGSWVNWASETVTEAHKMHGVAVAE